DYIMFHKKRQNATTPIRRKSAKGKMPRGRSWELILAAENLNSKFSLLSSNFSKAAFGKMPQAGMG
ncbi:MAG: hypothetical protein ACI38O_05995, partial [Fibrobacter intestinalis]|uniref:hypothetical protein n=1 Tax=Fibrobacter intestinalis TaxID=28122 RepID=UPI003EFD53B8